jgi:hypothetical protein
MSIGEEMTKADLESTIATFTQVRIGGPKEKRLRRVELMGEHTLKPLHWMKVTQKSFEKQVDDEVVLEEMEKLADVGDMFRPVNCDTKEPLDFLVVGYFSYTNLLPAFRRYNGMVLDGIEFSVEICKPWFIGLYPKGGIRPIGGS